MYCMLFKKLRVFIIKNNFKFQKSDVCSMVFQNPRPDLQTLEFF